jgi:hypothetical protein
MTIEALTDAEKYGVCSKGGHPWTPENTLWESSGRQDGRKRRRCRQCRKDKRRQAAKASTRVQLGEGYGQPRGYRHEAEHADILTRYGDFDQARKDIRPHCDGRMKEFSDYELEDAPSPEKAKRMCAPCALQPLCLRKAEVAAPSWGVLGGKVWVDGEEYKEGEAPA